MKLMEINNIIFFLLYTTIYSNNIYMNIGWTLNKPMAYVLFCFVDERVK